MYPSAHVLLTKLSMFNKKRQGKIFLLRSTRSHWPRVLLCSLFDLLMHSLHLSLQCVFWNSSPTFIWEPHNRSSFPGDRNCLFTLSERLMPNSQFISLLFLFSLDRAGITYSPWLMSLSPTVSELPDAQNEHIRTSSIAFVAIWCRSGTFLRQIFK